MPRKPSRSNQPGARRHAEGEHGDKTRDFIRREQITSRPRNDGPHPRYDPAEIAAHDDVGKDRLFENREQHDEANKGSEKTRRARDVERHGHEKDSTPSRKSRQSRDR